MANPVTNFYWFMTLSTKYKHKTDVNRYITNSIVGEYLKVTQNIC